MADELADILVPGAGGKKLMLDAVLPQLLGELRRLAAAYMRHERKDHTLQPTALVNEAYMKLLRQHSVDFSNRAQVLGVAAQIMRRHLRTYEDARAAEKRGGGTTLVSLSDAPEPAAASALAFSEVDEILNRLASMDERQAKVVELRIFGGLSAEETAEFLEVSVATVRRDWATGRIWMASELSERPSA